MAPATSWFVYPGPFRSNTAADCMPFVASHCSHLILQIEGRARRHARCMVGMCCNDMTSPGFKAGLRSATTMGRDCLQMPWRPAALQIVAPVSISLVPYPQPWTGVGKHQVVLAGLISGRAPAFMQPSSEGARRRSAWQRQGSLFTRFWQLTLQSSLVSPQRLQPWRGN